jgi:hypothetical protein
MVLFIFPGLALMFLDLFLSNFLWYPIIDEFLWTGPLWDLGLKIAFIGGVY